MYLDRLTLPLMPSRSEISDLFDNLSESLVLSNDGPYAEALSFELLKLTGGQYCVLFSSASGAIDALTYLFRGKTFITCPYTWVTSLSPFHRESRGSLVYLDIDPVTFQSFETSNRHHQTEDVVYLTHVYGIPNLEYVQNNLPSTVIFDGSHSLGVETADGKRIADHGLATVFSLHATKGVTSGEGGAVVTNDKNLFEKLTSISRPTKSKHGFDIRAFNLRMSEWNAGLALLSLQKFSEAKLRRRQIWESYRAAFGDRLVNLEGAFVSSSNYLYAIFKCDDRGHARKIELKLKNRGIAVRKYFDQLIGNRESVRHLHMANRLAGATLALPLHHLLTDEEVKIVQTAVLGQKTK